MITIENNNNQILLFGRDEKNSYVRKVDFIPYFYAEDDNGEFISIDGKKLKKIIVKNPQDVPIERIKYESSYEADIRYVNRYIIDEISEMKKEEIRICYLDIEVKRTEKGYESCEKANNPILMIGCYDSFDREKVRFCIGKTHRDEVEMLKDFIRYIINKNPDMLIAWNGDGFDFPFLVNRMKKLRIKADALCREGGKCNVRRIKYGVYNTHLFGRICLDLMRAYKTMSAGGRESWSLDYISNYEGVGGKEKYKGELDELYEKDIEKFIKYNDRDVELLVLLNEKLRIVEFFDEIRRLCFCRFEDVFMNTKMADCLCLKYAKEKFILPNSSDRGYEKSITGGYVKDNIPKLYNNVSCMDMKSLYPSIMIGFNTSYETLLPKKEDNCINMFDTYYYRKDMGIIPAIVKPLLERRKQETKARKEAKEKFGKDSIEYKSLDTTQYALKVIANSFYGVLLEKHFRLGSREVGQSITFAAQTIIKEVHTWFENKGIEVIYGDTDSCFISMGDRTIDDIKKLNNEINDYFKEFFKKYGVTDENNIFKLEFEKVFKTVLFKRKSDGKGVKKRYAGRVIWDGEGCDKLMIVGFESRRSDSPQIGRTFLKEVLKMITYEYPQEDIEAYIDDFKTKIKEEFTPEEIGLPISITKPLNEYKNQVHAKAARLANEKHNAQIRQGDKIKYIYVDVPGGVIGFKSDKFMWEGYKINYTKMIRRIVDLKAGPLFESLGWKHNYNTKLTKPKKEKILLLKDILVQNELW